MSKQQCPVCGQQAVGRKAAKRVQKWVDDSRLDRFMFDKLMQLAKAHMQDQKQALDKDKLLQQQLAGGTYQWNALAPDRDSGSEERSPKAAKRWAKEKLAREDEALRQQIKQQLWGDKKPPEPSFMETHALDALQMKNEKLARDRAYQRAYYHRNRERIERLRKQRAGRRASARSPGTGAKANGH